ncbi:T9SS type A sorting domain-containing protein, partial [bacterium]|nr:T9SS type A sorting domain-containing protein [bacterium]
WPAAFDKDCIAEHFVNNPNGGGAAFIGNSRYGWGSPGNAGRGYSEVLDRAFWEEIFAGNFQLGAALAISKARFVPYARWANVWRWVIYEVNILGDAATGAITGNSPISMAHEIEGGDLGITVEGAAEPVSGAVVSAFDDDGLIDRSTTDAHGFAHLSITGGSPPIYICARSNSEGFAAETLSVGAASGFFRFGYSDGYGYFDGVADCGDTVDIRLSMGGFDSDIVGLDWSPTANIPGPISTIDPPSTIAAGDSATFDAFFVIPEDIATDSSLIIDPNITHSGGTIGYPISLPIDNASMRLAGSLLGDIDSSLEIGETSQLWLIWKNAGSGKSSAGSVNLTCPGGEIDIAGSPLAAPSTEAGDTAFIGPFDISWSAGTLPTPVVMMIADYSPYPPETLYVATVPLGFTTDVEGSEYPFDYATGSLWHRSTRRAFSGLYSWWCGSSAYAGYLPEMADTMTSEPFVLGDDAELSFHAYMDFPNYGSDGLHVELLGSSDTVELDYLGSGGALLSFIVGWSEYRYPLENLPFAPDDSIAIRFRFTSDSEDQSEGIFLDDISLRCQKSGFTTGIADKHRLPTTPMLHVYPNPFNASISIGISGEITAKSRVEIYDLSGRKVRSLAAQPTTLWDGTASDGKECASGTYFVRLISPSRIITTRAVLLK